MLDRVTAALGRQGLAVAGAFHPEAEDGAPEGTGTLVLAGADGAAMWAAFSAAPEAADGAPNPLDRWSRRVLEALAAELGARALYPFGGPPYQPFIRWSARGEGMRPSPVGMPVSPARGLWASYRGALAFAERIALPPPPGEPPCGACPKPCASACPVGALTAEGYDVAACAAHIASPAGAPCRDGCRVRAACPVGTAPPPEQRRFHIAAFVAARQQSA